MAGEGKEKPVHDCHIASCLPTTQQCQEMPKHDQPFIMTISDNAFEITQALTERQKKSNT